MIIPIKIKTNLKNVGQRIDRIAYGSDKLSLFGAVESIMEDVKDVVLFKYIATSKKSGGSLEDELEKVIVVHGGSFVRASIGEIKAMPFYWKFQEFGTRPFQFEQPFVVRFDNKRIHLNAISKNAVASAIPYSKSLWKTEDGKLIKYITVNHPGIEKRGFFLSGKLFLETHGDTIISMKFSEIFNKLRRK